MKKGNKLNKKTDLEKKERNLAISEKLEFIYKELLKVTSDNDLVHKFMLSLLNTHDNNTYNITIDNLLIATYRNRSLWRFKKQQSAIIARRDSEIYKEKDFAQEGNKSVYEEAIVYNTNSKDVDKLIREKRIIKEMETVSSKPKSERIKIAIEAVQEHIPANLSDLALMCGITQAYLSTKLRLVYKAE